MMRGNRFVCLLLSALIAASAAAAPVLAADQETTVTADGEQVQENQEEEQAQTPEAQESAVETKAEDASAESVSQEESDAAEEAAAPADGTDKAPEALTEEQEAAAAEQAEEAPAEEITEAPAGETEEAAEAETAEEEEIVEDQLIPLESSNDGWFSNKAGTRYYYAVNNRYVTGFRTIKGDTYYFYPSTLSVTKIRTAMAVGWISSGGRKYYAKKRSGTFKAPLVSGFQKIGNYTYYFYPAKTGSHPKYSMAAGVFKHNGYTY